MQTSRWTLLKHHKEQQRLWQSNSRFIAVVAGRRSGKTELTKRKMVKKLFTPTDYGSPRYFSAAPTFGQAKRIFWNDYKELIPNEYISKVYESDLIIRLIPELANGELHIVGLDKPQRVEGSPWDGCHLDEYADMKDSTWTENIRPLLSDRNGFGWFTGVPEGLNHFKDLWDDVEDDVEWDRFHWKSADILPSTEIESAKRALDPRTFRQEYEASFEDVSGQVYYAYDKANEVDCKHNKNFPLILCVDFNVDPCLWLVAQNFNGNVYLIDEIKQNNTNTVEMCKEYLTRYGDYATVVYGDSAGSHRSTAGKSDYVIMTEMGLRNQWIKKANPPVKDRVNAMNKMLCNANGDRRLYHSPKCVEFKKDCQKIVWKGQDINKSDINRTHATDAVGYYVESEFGHNVYKVNPNKRFYK